MPIIEITALDHPGVEIYSTLTEAQLRNRLEPDKGIFIAESPKVIHVALGQDNQRGIILRKIVGLGIPVLTVFYFPASSIGHIGLLAKGDLGIVKYELIHPSAFIAFCRAISS